MNIESVVQDVQYCTALLRIITGLPNLKNLKGIFEIGSYEEMRPSGDIYRGTLFLTSAGLKEFVTISADYQDSSEADNYEKETRTVPLSEFESMIGKYSLNFDGLNKVVNKIANQLGEE